MDIAKTLSGFYRGHGTIARVGVFSYRRADGSMINEFVPPETLQDQAWLDSRRLAPVTLGHPPELVKKYNTAQPQAESQASGRATAPPGCPTEVVEITSHES